MGGKERFGSGVIIHEGVDFPSIPRVEIRHPGHRALKSRLALTRPIRGKRGERGVHPVAMLFRIRADALPHLIGNFPPPGKRQGNRRLRKPQRLRDVTLGNGSLWHAIKEGVSVCSHLANKAMGYIDKSACQ